MDGAKIGKDHSAQRDVNQPVVMAARADVNRPWPLVPPIQTLLKKIKTA
jgi:hypothetical protein